MGCVHVWARHFCSGSQVFHRLQAEQDLGQRTEMKLKVLAHFVLNQANTEERLETQCLVRGLVPRHRTQVV